MKAADATLGSVYLTPRGHTVVYEGPDSRARNQLRLRVVADDRVVLCGPGQVLTPVQEHKAPEALVAESGLEW